MAEPIPVDERLKKPFLKRMEKLRKLRRLVRLWSTAGMISALVACAPLIYFLFTGKMPTLTLDMPMYISPGWAVVLVMVAAGLFGSMVFYNQMKRQKDKLDKLRAGAVAVLQSGDAICDCKWTDCSCKNELIKEMSDKYDINLSY